MVFNQLAWTPQRNAVSLLTVSLLLYITADFHTTSPSLMQRVTCQNLPSHFMYQVKKLECYPLPHKWNIAGWEIYKKQSKSAATEFEFNMLHNPVCLPCHLAVSEFGWLTEHINTEKQAHSNTSQLNAAASLPFIQICLR